MKIEEEDDGQNGLPQNVLHEITAKIPLDLQRTAEISLNLQRI